jgi:serine/threonine protein kinase
LSRAPQADQAGPPGPPDLPGCRYLEPIGAGGNARVYLYEQELPSRKVAVKVLNESGLTGDARRRFTTEANVTAGLAHPHIVQVFYADVTPDGRPYLVMPYYPQPNLYIRARRAHFSVADVLRIGIQIGGAVETSHRNDVLHRDIKPQNILTDAFGGPALTDFGIATRKGGGGPEGLSVPWSPPEMLSRDDPGDERSDVYSLGATLWHLLVGRSPFEQPGGDNSRAALTDRIRSRPVPRTQRPEAPESLERLLSRTMAKDPATRPQSALDLIRALQSIEQELRLPLTQPILPGGAGPVVPPGGDTVARPASRSAQDMSAVPAMTIGDPAGGPPDGSPAPPGDDQADDSTVLRDGPAAVPASRPPELIQPPPPEQAAQLPARMVEPPARMVQPPGGMTEPPALMAQPAAGTTSAPAAGTTHRVRQFPPEPGAEAATVLRPAAPPGTGESSPPSVEAQVRVLEAAEPRPRASRVPLLAGTGLLVAVAVAGVLLAGKLGGHSTPGAAQPPPASGPGTINVGPIANPPAVAATLAGPGTVRFTWSENPSEAGDEFTWKRVDSGSTATGTTSAHALTVDRPSGTQACLEIMVTRADHDQSQMSAPVCK